MLTTPYRDDAGTTTANTAGPVCATRFAAGGPQLFCSAACRTRACRRRHAVPAATTPAGARRRDHTVYECGQCGQRRLGVQRRADCGLFAVAAGLGGRCPSCQQPGTLADLDLPERPR